MANQNIVNLKGEGGGKYATTGTITPAAPYTYFDVIFAHAAADIDATAQNITGTLTGVAIPAGACWYGRFSSITVNSGAITAYNKLPS